MTEYEFLKQQVEEIRARQKAEQEAPLRAEIATLLAEVEGWRQAASYISDLFDPVKGLSVSPEILRAVAQGAKHANTTLRSEVEKLRGIRPEWPPEPPKGIGLPRYGLRWNGPSTPIATPMDDGYWTPWHLAESLEKGLTNSVMRERESVEILSRHLAASEVEVKRLRQERDDYKSIATEGGFVERAALVQAATLRVRAERDDLLGALRDVVRAEAGRHLGTVSALREIDAAVSRARAAIAKVGGENDGGFLPQEMREKLREAFPSNDTKERCPECRTGWPCNRCGGTGEVMP